MPSPSSPHLHLHSSFNNLSRNESIDERTCRGGTTSPRCSALTVSQLPQESKLDSSVRAGVDFLLSHRRGESETHKDEPSMRGGAAHWDVSVRGGAANRDPSMRGGGNRDASVRGGGANRDVVRSCGLVGAGSRDTSVHGVNAHKDVSVRGGGGGMMARDPSVRGGTALPLLVAKLGLASPPASAEGSVNGGGMYKVHLALQDMAAACSRRTSQDMVARQAGARAEGGSGGADASVRR